MKNSLTETIDSLLFGPYLDGSKPGKRFEDITLPYDLSGINYEECRWTSISDDTETVITYILPGVEKSQLRVRVEQEDQESILVVEISEREGGGVGSKEKSSKFHFFPGEIPEKTSSELKDGVLTIRIPKEINSKASKKTILEIPLG
jgi:HSP20 family molecular chaperone IbpA